MAYSQAEAKLAVESGYWFLFRYKPELRRGQEPLHPRQQGPGKPLEDFLMGEVRYAALRRTFPEQAEALLDAAKADSAARYQKYLALSQR